jgi:hypothetical protein
MMLDVETDYTVLYCQAVLSALPSTVDSLSLILCYTSYNSPAYRENPKREKISHIKSLNIMIIGNRSPAAFISIFRRDAVQPELAK